LAIRPVFAASRASRAAVLVATHVRSVCKQTLPQHPEETGEYPVFFFFHVFVMMTYVWYVLLDMG
ncbi:hypothetical protein, partial [Burkholderia ubonensis]|uniref:hypothetical protein n=1 Tax=Burkholderia ubonensis TaxID=101571 RepID=UPI002FCB02D6